MQIRLRRDPLAPRALDFLRADARRRGRRGGRPKAMDDDTLKRAGAMLKDVENYPFIGDVIDQLKIGRTAFYRYFPPDRIKQLRKEHADSVQP